MLFGEKPRLPIDIDHPSSISEADPAMNFEEAIARRMKNISETLPKLREEGLKNLAKAQEKQKRQYDAKHQGTYYDVGDLVSTFLTNSGKFLDIFGLGYQIFTTTRHQTRRQAGTSVHWSI